MTIRQAPGFDGDVARSAAGMFTATGIDDYAAGAGAKLFRTLGFTAAEVRAAAADPGILRDLTPVAGLLTAEGARTTNTANVPELDPVDLRRTITDATPEDLAACREARAELERVPGATARRPTTTSTPTTP